MRTILFTLLVNVLFFGYSQEKKDSIPKVWKVNGKLAFVLNQSSFSNWIAGGSNTVAGNIALDYDFNYHRNKWRWDNKITSIYGLSYIDGQGVRKTDDRFEYNSLLGLKSGKYWFFSFISNFKTQYTRGYDYKKTPFEPISDFLSPAYWSFGPGMLWKKSDSARVNIAPASARLTFVSDEFSGKYGVDEGRNTSFGLGFNLSGYFKFHVMKNVEMENILAMYSDYLDKPQNIDVDYQMRFFIKINKNLSTNLGFHTIIDDNASSKIQFKQMFGLGLNYIFHKT
ncbi:Protein of unknown function [Tenacibaculum sp. MAR_2009_124]|uniref:DUF3078 domain-containing protein n=1 Tax=Tenacibaculum sp. MAR_2009_124 TaxID=1250059 RepID=UPI00089D2252|nr:DUF3078 domain-containing protein [Tenacibaculum sp. MAR_2009_124]SEC53496.1 Protein of unknown function [Tenacibaculum sp. MAR_2009_124]